MKKSKLKRKLKLIKVGVFVFGFMMFFALFTGINNTDKQRIKKEQEEIEETSAIIPKLFDIELEDYRGAFDILGGDKEESTTDVQYAKEDLQTAIRRNYTRDKASEEVDVPIEFYGNDSYDEAFFSARNTPAPSTNNVLASALQEIKNSVDSKNIPTQDKHIEQGRSSGILVGASGVSSKSGSSLIGGISDTITNTLGNLGNLTNTLGANNSTDAYTTQNKQSNKQAYLDNQAQHKNFSLQDKGGYASDHSVIAGSVIPIVMVTAINSDLPGMISARVTEDIYDTLYGTEILIPKGSLVLGGYDSSVSWGQKRLLVAWQRLTRPDGYSVQLEGMQSTDTQGASGVTGSVKTHLGASVATSIMTSLFNVGINATSYHADTIDKSKTLSSLIEDTGSSIDNNAKALANKFINKQPTINIKQGTRSYIFLNKDIVLPSFNNNNNRNR